MRSFTVVLFAGIVAALCCGAGDGPRKLPVKNAQVDLSVYGPWKDGSRRVRPWAEAEGERVVAEGLAWGVDEKGLGQRVILDGGHVYVRGPELPEGRLVRVVGTLRSAKSAPARQGAQGYGEAFTYFFIQADKVEPLDTVGTPSTPKLAESAEGK